LKPYNQNSKKKTIAIAPKSTQREHSANGKFSHKLIGQINEAFSVSRATLLRLWSKYRQAIIGREAPQLTRKSGLGRKMKHTPDDLKG
jgi:hypothetical protein